MPIKYRIYHSDKLRIAFPIDEKRQIAEYLTLPDDIKRYFFQKKVNIAIKPCTVVLDGVMLEISSDQEEDLKDMIGEFIRKRNDQVQGLCLVIDSIDS